jgi:surface antigen
MTARAPHFFLDRRMPRVSVLIVAVAAGLAGCNSAPPPPAAAPAVPEPPRAGVVGSAVGQSLDDKDRETAIAAQQEAVASGQRKSWRGGHGAFGFVTVEPEAGGCRDYSHRIFIDGRPQEAKGRACRTGDVWRVVS